MLLTLFLIFTIQVILNMVSSDYVEPLNTCGSIDDDSFEEAYAVDYAKISFFIPSTVTNKNLALYAKNSECFECSKLLVATGLSDGIIIFITFLSNI